MNQITHLFGIFHDRHRGGPIPMSVATSAEVALKIVMTKEHILSLEWAIISPTGNCHRPNILREFIKDNEDQLEELYDFYVGKLRQERSSI